MQSIDLIETYAYGMSKELVGEKEGIKCNNIIKQHKNEPDIDRISLNANDPYESKYQFLINKRESTDLKHLNDSKAFSEYANDMDDSYRNIEEYNPNKKCKIILIAFDNVITDMLSNKKT